MPGLKQTADVKQAFKQKTFSATSKDVYNFHCFIIVFDDLKLLYFQPILVKTKVKFRKNVKMNMLVQTLQNLKFILPLLA